MNHGQIGRAMLICVDLLLKV